MFSMVYYVNYTIIVIKYRITNSLLPTKWTNKLFLLLLLTWRRRTTTRPTLIHHSNYPSRSRKPKRANLSWIVEAITIDEQQQLSGGRLGDDNHSGTDACVASRHLCLLLQTKRDPRYPSPGGLSVVPKFVRTASGTESTDTVAV